MIIDLSEKKTSKSEKINLNEEGKKCLRQC